MPNEFVTINVSGTQELQQYLSMLSPVLNKTIEEAVAIWLTGAGQEGQGLKQETPYQYVSRRQAYGVPFFSKAQRTYVLSHIASGDITPGIENRTHQISQGWHWEESGGQTYVRNNAPGVVYVEGEQQAAQPGLVGWRRYLDIIAEELGGTVNYAVERVKAMLQSGLHLW